MQIRSILVLVALSLMPLIAIAQDASSPQPPGCIRQNSSRLPDSECDRTNKPPIRLKMETAVTTRITWPEMNKLACQAKVSIEYSQSGPVAKIKGTIDNETCAASSGSFVIEVTIRDAANEMKTLEFPQTWKRDDDKGVSFSGDYGIGDNVYLVRVHSSKMKCTCVKQEKIGE